MLQEIQLVRICVREGGTKQPKFSKKHSVHCRCKLFPLQNTVIHVSLQRASYAVPTKRHVSALYSCYMCPTCSVCWSLSTAQQWTGDQLSERLIAKTLMLTRQGKAPKKRTKERAEPNVPDPIGQDCRSLLKNSFFFFPVTKISRKIWARLSNCLNNTRNFWAYQKVCTSSWGLINVKINVRCILVNRT